MMQLDKLKDILSAPWLEKLAPFIESKEFDRITDFISKEKASGKHIMPSTDRIFTALNKCPPDKVKVIYCSQDPYNTCTPDGIAMSCSLVGKAQPSLREVQREIRRTVPDYNKEQPLDLSYLAEQGVLMINAALTVEKFKPNSHQGIWDKFIDYVFYEVINKSVHPVVYMMLGKEAQKFTKYARIGDYLLNAVHPAASSYSGGTWDCGDIFQRTNRYLEIEGLSPIKW